MAQAPEETKDAIVAVLLDARRTDAEALAELTGQCGLSDAEARAAMAVDLPGGYVSISLKAIRKLLPFLKRGMRDMAESDPEQSALHAAGYLRRDELQRRLFDKLPSLQFVRTGPLSDLPNPVVAAALYEVRKVVNAIVREHGKPDEAHVELARELKMSHDKRSEYNTQRLEREKERDAAAEYLRENGVAVSRENILRLMLWRQQAETCVYTGQPISFGQLFGGEVDVDHILPYSRTLDDSQMNKVVCFRQANAEKGDRWPCRWLGETARDTYERVCQRQVVAVPQVPALLGEGTGDR